MVAELLR
ncbi:hypothetical protein VTO73DRAFT_8894 [Trametes versicolor]